MQTRIANNHIFVRMRKHYLQIMAGRGCPETTKPRGADMIVQTVKFETSLSFDEVINTAKSRSGFFQELPGLVHKYYVALQTPNHYGGIYVWQSKEAMETFWATEHAGKIPEAYGVVGEPCIKVMEGLFDLDGPAAQDD
jgi:hypothetical protein